MEAETVPEILKFHFLMTMLIAQEDFIVPNYRESLKSCVGYIKKISFSVFLSNVIIIIRHTLISICSETTT
jgi:hypothetical protein